MDDSGTELVERVVAAWNQLVEAGPQADAEAGELTALLTADVKWVNPPEAVEPGTRNGPDEFVGAVFSMVDAFGNFRVEMLRSRAAPGMVAAANQLHIKAPRGDMTWSAPPLGALWTLEGGRVQSFEWFPEPDQAFAALDERRLPEA